MKYVGLFFVLLLLLTETFSWTDAVCTYPSEWVGKNLTDSYKEDIRFTNSTLSGWVVTIDGLVVKDWECYAESENLIVSWLTVSSPAYGNLFAFICMAVQPINDTVFAYHLLSDKQENADNERITVLQYQSPSICTICRTSSPPQISELRVVSSSGDPCDINVSENYEIPCNECGTPCTTKDMSTSTTLQTALPTISPVTPTLPTVPTTTTGNTTAIEVITTPTSQTMSQTTSQSESATATAIHSTLLVTSTSPTVPTVSTTETLQSTSTLGVSETVSEDPITTGNVLSNITYPLSTNAVESSAVTSEKTTASESSDVATAADKTTVQNVSQFVGSTLDNEQETEITTGHASQTSVTSFPQFTSTLPVTISTEKDMLDAITDFTPGAVVTLVVGLLIFLVLLIIVVGLMIYTSLRSHKKYLRRRSFEMETQSYNGRDVNTDSRIHHYDMTKFKGISFSY